MPKRVGQNCPGSFAQVAGEAARKKGLSVEWLGECNLPGGGSELSHSPPHPRSADGHPPPRGVAYLGVLLFKLGLEFGNLRAQPALDCGGLSPPYGFPLMRYRLCGHAALRSALALSSHPSPCGTQHRLLKTRGGTHLKAASSRRTPWLACGEQAEFCLSKTGKTLRYRSMSQPN